MFQFVILVLTTTHWPLLTATHKIRFKITALVLVYLLRMAFFQTLMASSHSTHVPYFKVSVAQHQAKNHPHLPVTHRSHTQKHITCNTKLPAIAPLEAFQFGSVLITEPNKIQLLKNYISPVFKNINDDALKRYSLHRTFII